jgi:hypothetical protein
MQEIAKFLSDRLKTIGRFQWKITPDADDLT